MDRSVGPPGAAASRRAARAGDAARNSRQRADPRGPGRCLIEGHPRGYAQGGAARRAGRRTCALGDESKDVELDVRGIGRDRDEVAPRAASGDWHRIEVFLETSNGDRACGLKDRARVLESIAHGRADLVVTHDHDVVHEFVTQTEDFRAELAHLHPSTHAHRAVDQI